MRHCFTPGKNCYVTQTCYKDVTNSCFVSKRHTGQSRTLILHQNNAFAGNTSVINRSENRPIVSIDTALTDLNQRALQLRLAVLRPRIFGFLIWYLVNT